MSTGTISRGISVLKDSVNGLSQIFQSLPTAIKIFSESLSEGDGIAASLANTFSTMTVGLSASTGVILGVVAAIGAVVAVTAVWANTQKDLENATEKADESIQQYSETVSELESLKSEYESLQDQIEELDIWRLRCQLTDHIL